MRACTWTFDCRLFPVGVTDEAFRTRLWQDTITFDGSESVPEPGPAITSNGPSRCATTGSLSVVEVGILFEDRRSNVHRKSAARKLRGARRNDLDRAYSVLADATSPSDSLRAS